VDAVEVGGLRIAFRRAGQGPPLLLLHGGASDGREWRPQIEQLADAFDVVAWDAPGCGGSDDPPEGFRLPDFADCAAGLTRALGLVRPHVLGISFGAGLALELYRRHPALPRSLLLASAYAGWAGSLPPGEVEERLAGALAQAERPPAEWAREWLPSLVTADAPREAVEEIVRIMRDVRPAGLRAMARSFAEADLRDVLPRVAVPALLLHGELDRRAPLAIAHELHATIPGATLVVMSGVGHQCNLEAPDRFTREVRAFLRAADR
jgi:pimeloyl-ACP methyl ester carboxylesterase